MPGFPVRGSAGAMISVFAALWLVGCALPTDGIYSKEAAQRTWDNAVVFVPEGVAKEYFRGLAKSPDFQRSFSTWMAGLKPDDRFPVAILMHNCKFLGLFMFDRLFAEAGVVTVTPNSSARGRGPSCDTDSHTGGLIPGTYEMRREEIDIALREIRKWPWVDQSKLFLAGHSEGAWIAAGYPGTQFAGRIAVGTNCYDGIQAGGDAEILIINGTHDPWRKSGNRCGGYSNVRHLMIVGGGHNELGNENPIALEAARELIARVLARKKAQ